VQIPATAGGVVPVFNLKGVDKLNVSGEVLAEIYMGKITKWNDSKLAALNAGVSLPDQVITPAWRTDGSGTNFVFTNYLATQSAAFKETIGVGKQVKWPVGQGGKGSEGVTAVVQQTPGAIAYVESAYADQNKLSYAAVKNKAGKFIKASPDSVSAAGASAVGKMTGQVISADIWDQPGDDAYPISSFT
jgi:phosphate transport system substrate-binding protein